MGPFGLLEPVNPDPAEQGPVDMPFAPVDLVRLEELARLVAFLRYDAATPSEDKFGNITRPKGVTHVEKVHRLRAAHTAAFGDIKERWRSKLRGAIAAFLRRTKAARLGPKSAAEVLDVVRRGCPSGTVPEALTTARIADAIRRSTLSKRGGGPGRKVNVDRAVDDLIAEVVELEG